MHLHRLEDRLFQLLQEKYDTLHFLVKKEELVAPNLLALLGPLTAARLIHKAGSLSKLSKAPASTV